ncbi:MAG: hypothetical protein ACXU84_21785, partial [Xanthobacteraceae bacterium]
DLRVGRAVDPALLLSGLSVAAFARKGPRAGHIVVDDIYCHGQQLMRYRRRATGRSLHRGNRSTSRIKFAQCADCAGSNSVQYPQCALMAHCILH